jgi:ABC-2 type transport system permease protein
MKKAAYIAFNEVRLYLQDKGDLAFSLLLPIVTFALIYGAFGGQTRFEATARVVDEDQGIYSALLVEKLDNIDGIDVELLTLEQADTRLERSDLLLVLVIPEGFSDTLESGRKAQLVFKQRGNSGQEGQIIASIIRSVTGEMSRDFQVRSQVTDNLKDTDIPAERIELVIQEYLDKERTQPAVMVSEEVTGGSPDFVNQFLPGIITMYVLFAVTLTARAIVEERRKGTLERLLTTRLSVGGLFFGKFLASSSRGFVQTLILMVLAYAVFQVFTPLSFLWSLIIAIFFAAAASAIGLVIASISRSEEGANWIAVVFTVITFMIAGTFFEITPGSTLDTISMISINRYANTALQTVINDGGSLADVVPELLVMIGVAVVGLVISRLLFKAVPGGK